MRLVIVAAVAILLSCDTESNTGTPPSPLELPPAHLELTVEPEGELKVGKYVRLKARITNRGERPVDAVVCLDHSDVGWRYPIMRASWTGPQGKPILPSGVGGGCGNSDAILDKHLVRLAPGESMDPFANSPYGNCTLAACPQEVGSHSAELTIDYSAQDPKEWNGSMERNYIDPELVRKRLANVPRVKLTAKAEFEILK